MEQDKLPRWQFRKKKKLEKRQKKRQDIAEERTSNKSQTDNSREERIIEEEEYKRQRQQWEEKEQKFKLIELAKRRAREKHEEAKAKAEKRWKEALLNLPFGIDDTPASKSSILEKKKNSTFKTFVKTEDIPPIPRKTYRERFNESKKKIR
ncbi:hypothetical protein A0J61_00148 [Choanephora cucurbitarum]|uniref:Uncharacterized protein n=1 Tax=Choanephora cucurbitarum TaxID=101091 RepID=A0A1C7NSZ3_9FUNG|nr:hypothetical protein A0J61_00148 [Choanephora cucurbitarum]